MTTERSTETSTEDLQAGVIRAIFTFVNPLNRFKRRVSARGKGASEEAINLDRQERPASQQGQSDPYPELDRDS